MKTGPATGVSRPVFARTFPVLSRAMKAGGMADYPVSFHIAGTAVNL